MKRPVDAIQPYSSTAMADLVLRSSNHVDFYVLGTSLRYISSTFRTMFALNTGQAVKDNEKKDGHPVVSVAEDSRTLRLLLDFIYPTSEERRLNDVDLFWKVAKASQKYCMKIIEDKLRKRIVASDLVTNNPLGVYAVATNLGWDDVAIAAARQTLQTPLESLPYADELKDITGVGFYRFLEYRLRCSKSSNPIAEGFTEFKNISKPCPTSPTDGDNVSRPTRQPLSTPPHQQIVDELKGITGVGFYRSLKYRFRYSKSSNPIGEGFPDITKPCPTSPTDASAPFNSSAPADLVLRSSNLVDFFVSGTLIRRLSVVFKIMFPLPPWHEVKNGMPIVRVEESSEILRCLLSVIHHDLDEPDMKDCQLYIQVVQAARKYRMTTIEQRLRKQATNSPLTNSYPLRVYIVAAALDWEGLAETVALNTFCQPLDKLAYVEELRFISGADLYRLVKYRFRCADAASSALEGDSMFPKYGFGQWNGHFESNTSNQAKGYDSTHPSLAYTQLKISPRGSTINDMYSKHLKLIASETGKFVMTPSVFFNIVRCARDAEKNVESAIAKVDFVEAENFWSTLWKRLDWLKSAVQRCSTVI